MYISILLPSIFALFALYKKKVSLCGTIAAWIMGIIITYFGDFFTFIALASTFILTITSDKLKKSQKDETRTIYQMFSNVLVPTIAIILYRFTNMDEFYIIYYATIASSLSDTLASSIGSLSRKKPINILTLRKTTSGESGAISYLGINASLMGGIIIGLIFYINTYDALSYLLIILMGLSGSLFDSILGATVQAKYHCNICNKNIEIPYHCKHKAKKYEGFDQINNDTVNLLNNIFVFIFTYLLLK